MFAQYWDKVPDQTMISNSSRFVAGGIGGVISQFCEPASQRKRDCRMLTLRNPRPRHLPDRVPQGESAKVERKVELEN